MGAPDIPQPPEKPQSPESSINIAKFEKDLTNGVDAKQNAAVLDELHRAEKDIGLNTDEKNLLGVRNNPSIGGFTFEYKNGYVDEWPPNRDGSTMSTICSNESPSRYIFMKNADGSFTSLKQAYDDGSGRTLSELPGVVAEDQWKTTSTTSIKDGKVTVTTPDEKQPKHL